MSGRQDFESAARSRGYDTKRWYEGYFNANTQAMWLGWSLMALEVIRLQGEVENLHNRLES